MGARCIIIHHATLIINIQMTGNRRHDVIQAHLLPAGIMHTYLITSVPILTSCTLIKIDRITALGITVLGNCQFSVLVIHLASVIKINIAYQY